MSNPRPGRVGTLRTAARTVAAAGGTSAESGARVAHQRRLVADLCRMLDPQPAAHAPGNGHADGPNGRPHGEGRPFELPLPPGAAKLSPRMGQTLQRLLAGDSEKEIACRFGRSRHTVHVYVKKLYERFGVSSRGELFALFVRAPAAPAGPATRGGPATPAAPSSSPGVT
jgi:DNA-binding CsgD family transcriptional regulator